SEQMARAIIDTALDAFVQIDRTGAITEWSPHAETMFGFLRSEVLGQNLARLIFAPSSRDEYRKGYTRFIDDAARGSPGHRFEIEAVRKDGVLIEIEVAMTALHRDSGTMTNAFMRDLTGHLLAFARKQPLQPHQTDVNALLADLKNLLAPTLGEQIEIESVLQENIWPTFVDRGQLGAAIVNLAVNARDAMPDGGKLT